ncbi:hypothetical protein CSHISOI_04593 [Colletotrichum shisoi]|uniref:Secreted protein n=1 Tax=Colletotrichum shisoi TaxID=2078593 RepID=A0A5Q4BUT7_9PEZI|nr:hypothetical protein CSHISOI_04593 [Colletotrichum shisoi]
MHLRFILVTLTYYVSASYALCYTSGRQGDYGKWLKEKDPTIDKERLSIACSALVGRGDVSFAKYESRSTCMQEDLRTKWDFKIEVYCYQAQIWFSTNLSLWSYKCLHWCQN